MHHMAMPVISGLPSRKESESRLGSFGRESQYHTPALKKTSLRSLITIQNVCRWKIQEFGGKYATPSAFMPLGWKITPPNRVHDRGALRGAAKI